MKNDLITVFGGSGFVGRYVVRTLCKRGARVRVAMRRPHLGHELRVMGVVGQVQLVQANVRDDASVARALEGADGAVNLVGILFQTGKQTFEALQAEGAGRIAEAAAAAGVARFVHVSAIGADAKSKAIYARTKAAGEAAVRAALPSATILRPSIVFGVEDEFFNRFAAMARFAPALPLIGGGKTRFQPVYVRDVADAVAEALSRPEAQGRTYELGGPRTYTFKELMKLLLSEIRRPRLLMPTPWPFAYGLGSFGELLGALPFVEPFLTVDQVTLLKTDNIVGAGGPGLGTLADLGISPETVEAILPTYMDRYRKTGRFNQREPGVGV